MAAVRVGPSQGWITGRLALALLLALGLVTACAAQRPWAAPSPLPATTSGESARPGESPASTPGSPPPSLPFNPYVAARVPSNPYPSQPMPVNPYAPPAPARSGAMPERRFRGEDEDALLDAMATRPVVRVIERFSSSTLVFHLDLGGGLEVAFKPARQGEGDWWRHEIAGFHLARTLGIAGRVPPAVSRRVPVRALEGYLHGAELSPQPDGTVEGAAIYWMPVLARTNLQVPESRAEWSRWMDPEAEIPPQHRRRALQLMALTVFDYLQANFDRWNSANIRADEQGDLVFRDNNRAWYPENLARVTRGGLRGVRRVPAWLLRGVERATPEALREALGRDPLRTERLLDERQLRAYERRRRALLEQIEGTARRYGPARVILDDPPGE